MTNEVVANPETRAVELAHETLASAPGMSATSQSGLPSADTSRDRTTVAKTTSAKPIQAQADGEPKGDSPTAGLQAVRQAPAMMVASAATTSWPPPIDVIGALLLATPPKTTAP